MNDRSPIYFIVSCARSGSTSLANILDTATNGRCLSEPVPNLNIETREMMEGRLPNPRQKLAELILPRIAKTLDEGLIHGEKNVTYGPFIPQLHEMLRCRFVFLKRDGRDVVTSLMNWHSEVFGDIYHECKERTPLSRIAEAARAKLPAARDDSDYARPRPRPGDPYFERWPELSRFEMAAWYWQFINRLYVENLAKIPPEDWIGIDYSTVEPQDIERVFDFLGLRGFDHDSVENMLSSHINSVWSRIRRRGKFTTWRDWDEDRRRAFDGIAAGAMTLLGYDDKARDSENVA